MEFNIVQILLVMVATFIAAIDQFNFLESLYQPIVMGPVIGAILGDLNLGLVVGGTYQLITIGAMPVGGAQPPNAVIGGIMATVFAITIGVDAEAAVGLAIPFAVMGQYLVTLLFTIMSGVMSKADKCAEKADTRGIEMINYGAMAGLGLFFSLIVLAGLLGGEAIGTTLTEILPQWVWNGLKISGSMMPFVGFAILMKVMLSKDFYGFFFAGFAFAAYLGVDLLFIAFIGFALAYWDFQISTRNKGATASVSLGGDEDGI